MCGQVGLSLEDMWKMSLRQLVFYWDGRMSCMWDHTASVNHSLWSLTKLVHDMFSKRKMPKLDISDFHPMLEKKKRGISIDAKNIGKLKSIFNIK